MLLLDKAELSVSPFCWLYAKLNYYKRLLDRYRPSLVKKKKAIILYEKVKLSH